MSHQPLNIHAGTQVVTKVGVHGSNNALVHPRGAVGTITRTPCGHEQHFLVRFPDGFEASLLRDELEVLKHFKDRLDPAGTRDFVLEEHVIYRCIVGSRAYGLETDASDTDLRGIYLAPAELQWSLYGAPEQFEDNATQSCYWELQKFLVMALKANPNILECLYSPLVDKVTPIGERLLAIRGRFLSQMIFQTFNGYALSQFKKIEQDLRNRGEVRWKHAMHLLRLLMTGAVTLREGRVPVHVGPRRDELLAVKRGEWSWEKVNAWRQELHRDFEQALIATKLPERPDYEAANELLVEVRACAAECEVPTKKDCGPLKAISDPDQFIKTLKTWEKEVQEVGFDKIVAIEALGLPYGGALACKFGKGLVVLRKAQGILEEDADLFQMGEEFADHSGKTKQFRLLKVSINPGDKVLLVDEHAETCAQLVAAARVILARGASVEMICLHSVSDKAQHKLQHVTCPFPKIVFAKPNTSPTHRLAQWDREIGSYWADAMKP